MNNLINFTMEADTISKNRCNLKSHTSKRPKILQLFLTSLLVASGLFSSCDNDIPGKEPGKPVDNRMHRFTPRDTISYVPKHVLKISDYYDHRAALENEFVKLNNMNKFDVIYIFSDLNTSNAPSEYTINTARDLYLFYGQIIYHNNFHDLGGQEGGKFTNAGVFSMAPNLITREHPTTETAFMTATEFTPAQPAKCTLNIVSIAGSEGYLGDEHFYALVQAMIERGVSVTIET